MSTLANELHPWKAPHPMLASREIGKIGPICNISIRMSELQSKKARGPMLVTDVGIVTRVISNLSTPHSSNDPLPMLAVPSGTLKCPSGSIVQHHCSGTHYGPRQNQTENQRNRVAGRATRLAQHIVLKELKEGGKAVSGRRKRWKNNWVSTLIMRAIEK